MSRSKTLFVCSQCGHESPRWLGRCPDCDSWNTFAEERLPDKRDRRLRLSGSAGQVERKDPVSIDRVDSSGESRRSTGIAEFDRVLGGGLVDGSMVLVSGEPGIGTSTLILQAAHQIARSGNTVLYVSGEESPGQIKMRAQRINAIDNRLLVVAESNLPQLQITSLRPPRPLGRRLFRPCMIPSTVRPWSVSQVREATAQLLLLCKQLGWLRSSSAMSRSREPPGPRVLEHMVDTVIYSRATRATRSEY